MAQKACDMLTRNNEEEEDFPNNWGKKPLNRDRNPLQKGRGINLGGCSPRARP